MLARSFIISSYFMQSRATFGGAMRAMLVQYISTRSSSRRKKFYSQVPPLSRTIGEPLETSGLFYSKCMKRAIVLLIFSRTTHNPKKIPHESVVPVLQGLPDCSTRNSRTISRTRATLVGSAVEDYQGVDARE